MERGFTIWISGLPFAGKSTLAGLLEEHLLERGVAVECLAAKEVQDILRPDLGDGPADQEAWIARAGLIADFLTRNNVAAVCSSVTPFRLPEAERPQVGDLVEVFCRCSLAELMRRSGEDQELKQLYDSYREPHNPEAALDTDKLSIKQCVNAVLKTLEVMELIPRVEDQDYSEAEAEAVKKRLKDLGYI